MLYHLSCNIIHKKKSPTVFPLEMQQEIFAFLRAFLLHRLLLYLI